MGQSKKHSLLEAGLNNLVGYVISLLMQIAVFSAVGCSMPLSTNALIGVVFMGVSMVRSYILRRIFNWWHLKVTS